MAAMVVVTSVVAAVVGEVGRMRGRVSRRVGRAVILWWTDQVEDIGAGARSENGQRGEWWHQPGVHLDMLTEQI